MSASILPLFFRAAIQQDWTQQELAEFYRVETVLLQSGISLETDRGLSDEGDPWYIFCRPQTGDVVVHFARHGSEYIAAGGGLDRVLRGRSFRDIIDSFMSRQPIVVSGAKGAETSVFLHPAALLSAFVATAFFLFTTSEAEAAAADQGGKEAAVTVAAGQARMPAVFQILIEAAGLAGNRDAWTALSTVAIAFSMGVAELQNERQASQFVDARRQSIEGANADTQALPQSERTESGGAELEPLVKWASVDLDTEIGSLLNEEAINATIGLSIIPAFDSNLTATGSKETDFFVKQGQGAVSGAGASTNVEAGVLQARSLDEFLGLADFSGAAELATEMLSVQSGDQASVAYQLVSESLEIAQHSAASDVLTKNLIKAISATHRAEGWPSDYISAEISFAGESVNLTAFDPVNSAQIGEIGASVVAGSDTSADMQAVAMLALEWFAQSHPNFKVVSLGRNVVVFDWSAINEAQATVELHSWTMDDGSTINIIGTLPDAFSTIA